MTTRRPTIHLTLSAVAMAALDAEAERQGVSRSLCVELLLRKLPPVLTGYEALVKLNLRMKEEGQDGS